MNLLITGARRATETPRVPRRCDGDTRWTARSEIVRLIHAFKRRVLPAVAALSLSFALVAQSTSAPAKADGPVDLASGNLNAVQVVALLVGIGGFIWHAAVLTTTVKRNDKHTHEQRNRFSELGDVLHRIDRRLLKVELKIGVDTSDDDDAPKTPTEVTWFSRD